MTGASSGLGVEFAERFARYGSDLVLVARRLDRLEALAARLQVEYGISATAVEADLSVPGASATLKSDLDAAGITVTSLVNNAGFGTYQPFLDEDPDRITAEVALNVGAVVDLSRAFLPGMVRAGGGVLLNVASTAAYQPLPGMAVYAATKAFVLNFTEALAVETKGTSVTVLVVSPGPTETEFFDVLGNSEAAFGAMQTPAQVMDTTFGALEKSRPPASVVSGLANTLQSFGVGLLPRPVVLAVTGRMFARNRTSRP